MRKCLTYVDNTTNSSEDRPQSATKLSMEIQSPFILMILLITFFFFLFKLVKPIKCSGSGNKGQKLPPGPWKLPLIGSMLSIVSSEPPHYVLRELARKHGPLMHLQLGEISALVVSTPQLAKEILIKHDLAFASRPELLAAKIALYNSTDIAFSSYGSYWRQMRKICTLELLSAKKVQSFSSIREEEVKLLIRSILSSTRSPINLSEKIFTLTNTITSRAAFGRSYKDQESLVQMLQELADLAGGFDVADLFPSYKFLHVITRMRSKLEKLHQNLDKILSDIIYKHKENLENTKRAKTDMEGEDLIDILLRLQDSGNLEVPITSDNIKAVIMDIFSAGTDATSATVEWAMSEMARNAEVLKKAQAEVREAVKGKEEIHENDLQGLEYLKLVIKETLRLHPPAPLLLPRECSHACKVDGYIIPVKTKVIVNAWALGRDPEYWNDAESFLPERFANSKIDFSGTNLEYLPFGAGRRLCPGILFALSNIELVLAHLLYHFDWEIPGQLKPQDLDMRETFGAAVRRKVNLYLIATPYSPLC